MFRRFVSLELKRFLRSRSLGANIGMKILMIFIVLYLIGAFLAASIGGYELLKTHFHRQPFEALCSLMIYIWILDLLFRYMIQQLSGQNIKPFLTMNIKKGAVVRYTLLKSLTFFSNWGWAFFFVPFSIRAGFDGVSVIGLITFNIAVAALFIGNNFLNFLLNGKTKIAYVVTIVTLIFGLLDYYKIFSLAHYSREVFYSFYQIAWLFILPILWVIIAYKLAFQAVSNELYLDEGLEEKHEIGHTQNIAFLDKFGILGTFINNDVRLIKRNKIAKGIVISAVLFLFYGLLFLTSSFYKVSGMMIFMGVFATGGFQIMFGQRIPSFDSSYYPLMMTLNVPYREYLNAKWWLMNMATAVSIVLCTFYLYFGWELYLSILAGGIFNLGVNSQLVLLTGAFNKTPIDLNAKTKAFAQKNNFNIRTMLISILQFAIPMIVYSVMAFLTNLFVALLSIIVVGIIGFLLKNRIFNYIVSIYKKQKYSTIAAFKEV